MKNPLRIIFIICFEIAICHSYAETYNVGCGQLSSYIGITNSYRDEVIGNEEYNFYVYGSYVHFISKIEEYKPGTYTYSYNKHNNCYWSGGIGTGRFIHQYQRCTSYIIVKTTAPSHSQILLGAPKSSGITRWERSYDNGATWTVLENSASATFTEQDSQRGVAMYRVLCDDGQYYDVTTMTYYDEVPEEIVCSPKTVSKTVDDAVTFTLDVVDDGYTYQWYHNEVEISGATAQTLTIDPVKTADAGTYYCIVSNPVSETKSTECTLTTAKCAQYITFPELDAKTFGDDDFTLPATTDKGLTIQYTSSNQSVATVGGNTVHIVGPGETYITANQPGDNDYLEAAYVSRKLTVNKISQTINFPEIPTKTYEDIPFTLPDKSDKGLTVSYKIINTEVATVSGNTVTITGAGTTEIIATQEGDATHYAATPVTRTITVNKQVQTLNFPSFAPKVYGDAPIVLNATTDKNLTVRYEAEGNAVSIENNIVTIVRPGSAKITATQEGNKNYLAIEPIDREINVYKAPQTINWAEIPNKTFGDEPFQLPKTTDKGLTIAYSSSNDAIAKVSGNTVTINGAGSAEITATQDGDEFYNPAASVTLTINVAKAYQTINFPEFQPTVYGSSPMRLTATTQSSAIMRYESSDSKVATVEGDLLTVTGAGKCYITAYADGDANYYAATPVQRELNVGKSGQEVVFTEISTKTYGDAPFTLVASASNGQAVTFASSAPSVISVSGTTATVRGAGTAVITATQAGNNNYESASEKVTVTVEKATLIATADNQTRFYGDENPDFTISWNGFVNGDSDAELSQAPVITTKADINSNVGTYDIVIGPFTDSNYEPVLRNGTLTVVKAPLKVIAQNAEKTYGDANPSFTCLYEGFKNGQSEMELLNLPYLSTTAKSMSPVGEYPITAEGAEARNYELEYIDGILTINKAELTAALQHATREYGLDNEYTISYSGFKGSDKKDVILTEPTVNTSADKHSDTGLYNMTLEGGDAQNYTFRFKYPNNLDAAQLTVTKAPLIITADDKSKVYLSPNPRFTLSYSGFRNNDTEADLDQFPYVSCNATTSSEPGEYPIVLTGGFDNNYEYILVNGTLYITDNRIYVSEIKLESGTLTLEYPYWTYALSYSIVPADATNKSIEWTSSDEYVAKVDDGTIIGIAVGEANITATAKDGSGVSATCHVSVTSDYNGEFEAEISANMVFTVGTSIVVRRASDDMQVKVFTTNGSMVYSGYDERIDTLVPGYYIVVVGTDSFKIKL